LAEVSSEGHCFLKIPSSSLFEKIIKEFWRRAQQFILHVQGKPTFTSKMSAKKERRNLLPRGCIQNVQASLSRSEKNLTPRTIVFCLESTNQRFHLEESIDMKIGLPSSDLNYFLCRAQL
jgi:hypothetical protein